MNTPNEVSRRRILEASAAIGGLAIYGAVPLLAEQPGRTPSQTMGPFYPVQKPLDQDADMTIVQGKAGRAAGQVIHVMGRVLNTKGQVLPGVRLEIWQANTHGRYAHPRDHHPAPLDPNFEGYAQLLTDSEGRYRFKTIKPGSYPMGSSTRRSPHIHFDVTGRNNRLVTQMYFAGEPLNEQDGLLLTATGRERLIATLRPPTADLEPDSLLANWDIVLEEG
jgi:protocatechuate 3,4-dioxygenase beta subunit